jgi:ABC-type glycerol-3-phosphate transport system substrate-binding protein
MNLVKVASISTAVLIAMQAIIGCASTSPAPAASPEAKNNQLDTISEPVTLKAYIPTLDDAKYKQYFADPIAKKFPNVNLVRLSPKATTGKAGMEELIAQGETPDFFYTTPAWFGKQKPMDVFDDLTPLIKKYNFDLQRLQPTLPVQMKAYSEPGKIEFLPVSRETLVLMYNKGLFDRFGVPYPKDKMTWEEVRTLAAKLTRNEGGKTYRGLDITPNFLIHSNQKSIPLVDNKTNSPLLSSNAWADYLGELLKIYEVPGNRPTAKTLGSLNSFYKDQDVAMYVGHLAHMDTVARLEKGVMDWDLVTMPVFKDLPDTGTQEYTRLLAITPTSKNKDAAFKVIAHLLSDEVQLEQNKSGVMTVLKDEAIKKQIFKDLKDLDGKNIGAITALKPATTKETSIHMDYVVTAAVRAVEAIVTGTSDLNSALRKETEVAQKNIDQVVSSSK